MIVGWRAWYVRPDGAVMEFTSRQIAWEDLPDDGMLGIRWYEDTYHPNNEGLRNGLKITGMDYYFMADGPSGIIMGADVDRRGVNVPDEIRSRYTNAKVKRGIWTDPDTFDKVWQDIKAATELP